MASLLLSLVVLLIVVSLLVELAHLVRADGYGRTPPPPDRPVDPRLPDRPYAEL